MAAPDGNTTSALCLACPYRERICEDIYLRSQLSAARTLAEKLRGHRRHSSIGYFTPAEFEDRVDENADTASRHDAPPQDAQRSEHRITGP